MEICSSAEQPAARHPVYSVDLAIPSSLVGRAPRLQSERYPEELQGDMGEHERVDRVPQVGDEDHQCLDRGDPRPREVHELLCPSVGLDQGRGRDRVLVFVLRHRGRPARGACRREGRGQVGDIDYRVLAASAQEQREYHVLQRSYPVGKPGGKMVQAVVASVSDQLPGGELAQEESVRVQHRCGDVGGRGAPDAAGHGLTFQRR